MKYAGACIRFTRTPLLLVALCLSLSGCAHLPFIGQETPTAPPPTSDPGPATEPASLPAPSPTGVQKPPATKVRAEEPARERDTPLPDADVVPAADTTSAISPAPPDSSAPAPVLSADIPPAEKAKLLEANRRDRQKAEDLLRKIASRELSSADAEMLRTAEDLLRAAQDAELRGEIQDAANLARKAWLLALDLSGR